MSWFGALLRVRSMMFLATPLVVVGTLWWRSQTGLAPDGKTDPDVCVLQNGPPEGISTDEWEAARSEFEAMTDGTLYCGVEEMPAYWRLLKWCARQWDCERDRNLFSQVSFGELVNRPSMLRGAPVQVDLHICRITSYAAPENGLGIQQLYEVWGWSEDSRGSLYVAVTPDLPPGMHAGENVNEQAILCGYFYKIQGYLASGSASQAIPSAAPMIIGRMERWKAPLTMIAKTNELWLSAGGLVLAVSFVWLLAHRPPLRLGHRGPLDPIGPNATAKLEQWLDLEGRVPSHPIGSEPA
jgi:hypothetical protein